MMKGEFTVFRSAMVKPRAQLLSQWIADSPSPVEKIYLNREEDAEEPIGEGFEVSLGSLWWALFKNGVFWVTVRR